MQAQALLRKAIRDTTAELDDDDDEEDPDKQHKMMMMMIQMQEGTKASLLGEEAKGGEEVEVALVDERTKRNRNKRSQRPTMLRRNSMICPSLRNHAL